MQKGDAAIQFDSNSAVGESVVSTRILLEPEKVESAVYVSTACAAMKSGPIVPKQTLTLLRIRLEYIVRTM